jgi:hypothetical protein
MLPLRTPTPRDALRRRTVSTVIGQRRDGVSREERQIDSQCVFEALECPPQLGANSSALPSGAGVEWNLDPEACVMSRSLQLLLPGGGEVTDRFFLSAMTTAEEEWEGDIRDLALLLDPWGAVREASGTAHARRTPPSEALRIHPTTADLPRFQEPNDTAVHDVVAAPSLPHPALLRPIHSLFSISVHLRAQPPSLEGGGVHDAITFKTFETWITTSVDFWSCIAQNARNVDDIFRSKSSPRTSVSPLSPAADHLTPQCVASCFCCP